MRTSHRFTTLLLPLVLTGCASDLAQWRERELIPYLSEELSQHPRFKQQPISLVDMRGNRIDPQIDQLTAGIREQAFNALLQTNGANITWQSPSLTGQHHTQLLNVQCQPKQQPRYYIGFDLKPVDDRYRLSVKALDPEQGQWVSGFGKHWEGSLNEQEKRLLEQTQTDEMLRGLRALPFNEHQTDLLAAYLAKNISCLLKQSAIEPLTLHVDSSPQDYKVAQDVLSLVGLYLSQFNEVRIEPTAGKARLILQAQLHHIDGDLHQIWLIVRDRESGQSLKGLYTTAYFQQGNPLTSALPTVPAPREELPAPEPAPHSSSGAAPAPRVELFEALQLIQPIGEPFCRTNNPWVTGVYPVAEDGAIEHCFGLDVRLNRDGAVFLINEDAQGTFYKLPAENGSPSFALFAGQLLRYPRSNLFSLPDWVEQERIHAIAVTDPALARRIRDELATLPDCCGATSDGAAIDWIQRLHDWQNRYPRTMDWRILKIRH